MNLKDSQTKREDDTSKAEAFEDIMLKRLSRRNLIKLSGAACATATLSGCVTSNLFSPSRSSKANFEEVGHEINQHLNLPPDHQYQTLLRWGDPLFVDAPEFDPFNQSEQSQLKQFGFNNDYVGFISLSKDKRNSEHGLLVVNHEESKGKLMHPGVRRSRDLDFKQTQVDIAAQGLSIVEIEKINGHWQVLLDSKYNRRITPYTESEMTGPVAGSERLKTVISQDGFRTLGTYGNCAGGLTPWGTVLTAEENVQDYFTGDVKRSREEGNYKRFGYKGKRKKSWSNHFERWDLEKNLNEFNHVGWIVEIDPFDPISKPRKRTALGRCQHEGCNLRINDDGRVVAYTGDDDEFEYIYRFVSKEKYIDDTSEKARAHNLKLLEEGELSVAKFDANGALRWMPIIFGEGPLNESNQFYSQADVLIEVKRAGDLLGATPMDRPEDIEVNPGNDKVYVMLTKNNSRKTDQLVPCNPRAKNKSGHIIELTAPGNDHTSKHFFWDVLLLAGNPEKTYTNYHPETSNRGWLACPDNCTFDNQGSLWVATDGGEGLDIADGLWRIEVEGLYRGFSKRFMSVPVGSELCGPFFTPDNKSLFCAIQHPGGDSHFDTPSTRWPDFNEKMPPRPSVVVINKQDGSEVGR